MDIEQPITCSLGPSARLLTLLWGILLGSSTRSSGDFGTKVRVSVLASSQDSLPDIGNIQSDNLRDIPGVGKVRHLRTASKSWSSRTQQRPIMLRRESRRAHSQIIKTMSSKNWKPVHCFIQPAGILRRPKPLTREFVFPHSLPTFVLYRSPNRGVLPISGVRYLGREGTRVARAHLSRTHTSSTPHERRMRLCVLEIGFSVLEAAAGVGRVVADFCLGGIGEHEVATTTYIAPCYPIL